MAHISGPGADKIKAMWWFCFTVFSYLGVLEQMTHVTISTISGEDEYDNAQAKDCVLFM